jgi:hypothetical protein
MCSVRDEPETVSGDLVFVHHRCSDGEGKCDEQEQPCPAGAHSFTIIPPSTLVLQNGQSASPFLRGAHRSRKCRMMQVRSEHHDSRGFEVSTDQTRRSRRGLLMVPAPSSLGSPPNLCRNANRQRRLFVVLSRKELRLDGWDLLLTITIVLLVVSH